MQEVADSLMFGIQAQAWMGSYFALEYNPSVKKCGGDQLSSESCAEAPTEYARVRA